MLLYAIFADADGQVFNALFRLGIKVILTLSARELRIQTRLRLLPQIFHHARKDNNNSVAGIGCFVADCGIVRRFARLNIAKNKAAPLKRLSALRISQQIDNFIGNLIERRCYSWVPMLRFFKVFFIAIPEEEIQVRSTRRKP